MIRDELDYYDKVVNSTEREQKEQKSFVKQMNKKKEW